MILSKKKTAETKAVKLIAGFTDVERLKTFVSVSEKSGCRIFAKSGPYIVDGKSLLGLLSLPLSRTVEILIKGAVMDITGLIEAYAEAGVFPEGMHVQLYARVNSIAKAKAFCLMAGTSNCEVLIADRHARLDGASIMGIFALNLAGPLKADICGNWKDVSEFILGCDVEMII